MTIILLHLSDIHIRDSHDPILKKASAIAKCGYSTSATASHLYIVVSGDIANSGEAAQYALASQFLNDIKADLVRETHLPVSFVVVPGNHDCDFSKDSGTRNAVLQTLDTGNPADDSMIETCTAIQHEFFNFRSSLEASAPGTGDNLWRAYSFDIEGRKVNFECLNVSWVSRIKEKPGTLHFPFERYAESRDAEATLNIVVMHHPFNWYSQGMYRPFRRFLRQRADILLTGHEHEGNVGFVDDAEAGKGAFVEGCVLQHKGHLASSSFNVIVVDLDTEQFSSTRYEWDNSAYKQTEEGSWSAYRDLPTKRPGGFRITESFQARIDDPGAFLKHPSGSSIALSDIFVYPDLRKVETSNAKRRTLLSATHLQSVPSDNEFVVIEGDEKSGRTSLLLQLYQNFHDRGFCPLLLEGRALKRAYPTEIDSVLHRALVDQYGSDSPPAFLQLERSKKILLLDNFDETPLRDANAQTDVLLYLKKKFHYGIVTVDEIFEINELLSSGEAAPIKAEQRYRLQHFGYARRTEIIKRWFSLGADGTCDESTFVARCEQAERAMDLVMTKAVIPSIPLYLLTLLQSVEMGRSGDFKDSGLGYYYQFLLTEALRECGVKPDKLTELFQYSIHLAWHFHSTGKKELSNLELRRFNDRFSREWHTVDFEQRLRILLDARILQGVGQEFGFRYPYIYYYLKGQYLSENLASIENREYVSHCCRHLYVRDNANTVLFLAHHTHDRFVIDSILESLKGLFRSQTPVTFNGDVDKLNELIQDAPKLIYSGESPHEHRQRASELRDQLDDGEDGLAATEEKTTELSLFAQVTSLLKTTEILGQIVKNQYAKISRVDKQALISELCNRSINPILPRCC